MRYFLLGRFSFAAEGVARQTQAALPLSIARNKWTESRPDFEDAARIRSRELNQRRTDCALPMAPNRNRPENLHPYLRT